MRTSHGRPDRAHTSCDDKKCALTSLRYRVQLHGWTRHRRWLVQSIAPDAEPKIAGGWPSGHEIRRKVTNIFKIVSLTSRETVDLWPPNIVTSCSNVG